MIDFREKLFHEFSNHATEMTLAKGDFLIRKGEIERNLYFVESGALRVFYVSEFEEQIIRFGYRNSILNSLASYLKESPSEFYIEAIRKTTVKVIPKTIIDDLIYKDNESLKAYLSMMEELVTQQIDREIDLLVVSPSERLERVLKRSPNLFQEVPLKYIASYLRMTPETLSRIRNS